MFIFLTIAYFCAALCFAVWFMHRHFDQSISILLLIGFAVVFRLIGVLAFPILEDDMYRYLWDAKMTVEIGTPYLYAPTDFIGDASVDSSFASILAQVNYPDIKTVYGPANQWVFALAFLIAPGEIWALQLIFALIDIAVIAVLLCLTKPNNVLLYAWCPLIIKEFAFSAHPDVLCALFIMLAVLCYTNQRFIWVGTLLACAAGAKVFALILAPFLLHFDWKGWFALLLTGVLIALPFGVVNAWVPEGLIAMANDWLFNAPLYLVLINWLPFNVIKVLLVSTLVSGAGLYFVWRWRNESTEIPRGEYLFAALLLVSPALNAWYLVLLLVFATLRPSCWAWVFSLTILLSYITGKNLNDPTLQSFEIPNLIMVIQFGLIVLVAAIAYRMNIAKVIPKP